MSDVFHLGLSKEMLDGATLAIIPGDPDRVKKIAQLMEGATFLASHREFTSYLAYIDGNAVVVCSTGIGGPSTSIAVEELAQLGVRTFLRAGTTGAIQPHVNVGDLIVTHASVRLDGASFHFAPIEYPAVADLDCTTAIIGSCREADVVAHIGITASSDTFYQGQERYDTVNGRMLRSFKGSMQEWQDLGVLNYEMESATLFTMCTSQGWKAGCVSGVIVNRTQQELPDEATIENIQEKVISVVVESARKLLM
ncbi:MAG: uridine phosphorylase [Psychromonas sp.]|nr:uridine phosphorylase [Psychromonas sp.]